MWQLEALTVVKPIPTMLAKQKILGKLSPMDHRCRVAPLAGRIQQSGRIRTRRCGEELLTVTSHRGSGVQSSATRASNEGSRRFHNFYLPCPLGQSPLSIVSFNQDKAIVGAFSVIIPLRKDLRLKLYQPRHSSDCNC